MNITVSEMVQKINEAISGGNQLAASYKKRAMQYHDMNSQSIKDQIVQGTPGEKKIVLAGNIKGYG